MLGEGACRTVHKTVENIRHTLGLCVLLEYCVKVSENRHFLILIGIIGVCQRVVIVGNSLFFIGLYQCFIEQLPLLVCHIRDQQAEENMQSLDLRGKRRFVCRNAIDQLVCGLIRLSYLHNIDAVLRGRRDLYKLTANVLTGTVKFVSL